MMEKEKLYEKHLNGEITLEELQMAIFKIDQVEVKYSDIIKVIVGIFLPLLFVKPNYSD